VEIRDQFTETTGPIPDEYPARICLDVPSSMIRALGKGGLDVAGNLLRDAAGSAVSLGIDQ
jgi:hypothetical protein